MVSRPRAARARDPRTTAGRSGPPVPIDHQPHGEGEAGEHAQREDQRMPGPVPDYPAEAAVHEHPRDQVAEDRPAYVLAAVRWLARLACRHAAPARDRKSTRLNS